MQAMASGTSVDDVMTLLDTAATQTQTLQAEVDGELAPQIEHWPSGVNTILEHFNPSFAIDYDAILQQSEKNFEDQEKLRSAMSEAAGTVTTFLRQAERVAEQHMQGERQKMQSEIDKIMANRTISTQEKMARIEQLKADFDETQDLTQEKARLIASSQNTAQLSMKMQQ